MSFFRPCVLALILLSFLTQAAAAQADSVVYVRAGASGSGSGADWTNASSTLPATLTRGFTYYVADGSYGSYTFDDAASGTIGITIRKATPADHGTDSGWQDNFGDGAATLASLTIRSTAYLELQGLTVSGGTDIMPPSGGLPSRTHHITLRDIQGTSLFIVAEDVLIQGGSFGGFNGCDTSKPEDVVQIWEASDSGGVYHAASRITFDGVAIHDVTDNGNICAGTAGSGRHVDCMQILSGHYITIRNSIFYNCATSDIIAQGFRDTLDNITVENNFFQSVLHPGATLNFAGGSDTISGTNYVQYNTIRGFSQFAFPKGGSVIVRGNILQVGACGQGVYSYNVFTAGSSTCGTNVRTGTPSFVNDPSPAYLNGNVPNYHLLSSDTVAKDRGDLLNYPPTDIDRTPRYIGTAPDVGADEFGSSTTPPPPAPPTNVRVVIR